MARPSAIKPNCGRYALCCLLHFASGGPAMGDFVFDMARTILFRALAAPLTALSAAFIFPVQPASGATCESLTTLNLPDTTITLAKLEPAGTFNPPRPYPYMFGGPI